MSLVEDVASMVKGLLPMWNQPYDKLTTAELVKLKIEQQVLRDASDDPTVRAACNARISIINPFLDVRVAEDDADRLLSKMSENAQGAFALKIQNLKSRVGMKHG